MKLYCGTYKKYNEGSLFGAWMDLDDYEDAEEFTKACLELHKDEKDPELMFQDYEADYKWEEKLYGESHIPEEYWEIKQALEDNDVDPDVFQAYINCTGYTGYRPTAEDVEYCRDRYCGKYDSGADYAEELARECGEIKEDCWLMKYIDWEAVWRDMSFEGYSEEDGYIFDSSR